MNLNPIIPPAQLGAEIATVIAIKFQAKTNADLVNRAQAASRIAAALRTLSSGDAVSAIQGLTGVALDPPADPGVAFLGRQLLGVASDALQVELNALLTKPVIDIEARGAAAEVAAGIDAIAQRYLTLQADSEVAAAVDSTSASAAAA